MHLSAPKPAVKVSTGSLERPARVEDALGLPRREPPRRSPGEAGIGKTRLATELAARAQRLDWEVLWGACSEAEFSLPYLPLVEAVGNYLSRQDTDLLADQLGAARRELAQLFPLLGRDEPDAPVGDPTQAKLRLFEAVVGLLSLPARERRQLCSSGASGCRRSSSSLR